MIQECGLKYELSINYATINHVIEYVLVSLKDEEDHQMWDEQKFDDRFCQELEYYLSGMRTQDLNEILCAYGINKAYLEYYGDVGNLPDYHDVIVYHVIYNCYLEHFDFNVWKAWNPCY